MLSRHHHRIILGKPAGLRDFFEWLYKKEARPRVFGAVFVVYVHPRRRSFHLLMLKQESGFLFIVSGPAGIGKTTVCDQMLKEIAGVERAVTSTTRETRRGEIDTVDYYFFDHDTFQAKTRWQMIRPST